jgi:hypothetical protein
MFLRLIDKWDCEYGDMHDPSLRFSLFFSYFSFGFDRIIQQPPSLRNRMNRITSMSDFGLDALITYFVLRRKFVIVVVLVVMSFLAVVYWNARYPCFPLRLRWVLFLEGVG